MVLYKVHWESRQHRYYSTVWSKATLFQIVLYALMIIPPFFIAYATNDLWMYTSTYREQPKVYYLHHQLIQIGDDQQASHSSVWSSFPNLNALLQPDEVAIPTIKNIEQDINRDGRNDILYLSFQFTNLRHRVNTLKLLLFFEVRFSLFSSVALQSLIYVSQSWATPTHRVWIGGELGLRQRLPFPASGRVDRYNSTLFNTSSQFAEEFEIRNILSSYNERNVTVFLLNPSYAWDSGNSDGNFAVDIELRYPPMTVTYSPGFWQLIKFAWIQYFAVFVVFWWLLQRVQSFIFQNQIIMTVKQKVD